MITIHKHRSAQNVFFSLNKNSVKIVVTETARSSIDNSLTPATNKTTTMVNRNNNTIVQ